MTKELYLEFIRDEFRHIEKDKMWKEYFMELMSESIGIYKKYSMDTSKSVTNRKLNRYTDVFSYDHSRVIIPDYNETDYINANYVNLENTKYNRRYILAQGPLPHTVSHFWSMIWNENSSCIVMVTKDIEKDKIKCARYYPTEQKPLISFEYRDFTLNISLESTEIMEGYIKNTLKMQNSITQEERIVQHFYYLTWPDFGVPQSPNAFLQFLWDIRASGGLDNPDKPAVIHCSAGIGRSGTFVVIDLALLALANDENINIRQLILELRKCRLGLVQSPDQLRFLYVAIMAGAKEINETQDKEKIPLIDFLRSGSNLSGSNNDYNGQLNKEMRKNVDVKLDESKDKSYDNLCEETDSNFSDNSDTEVTSSAIDRAAVAARNRRGVPLNNGFEDSISFRNKNESNTLKEQNDGLHSSTSDSRREIRATRIIRTQRLIDTIRSNMRQKDMQRERWFNQVGLNQIVRAIRPETKTSFLIGCSVFVGLISVVSGYVFYRYNN